MKHAELRIEGMTCDHCIMSVKRQLSKVPGVTVEEVKIGTARVQYDEMKTGLKDLEQAVDDAGYQVIPQ